MKMVCWGYFVLVFNSSGVNDAYPGDAFACIPGGSRSEFVVGHATTYNEVPSLVQRPPMGCEIKFVILLHIVLSMFGTSV